MKFLVLAMFIGTVFGQNYHPGRQQHSSQSPTPGQYQEEHQRSVNNDRQFSTTTYVPILQWNKEQEHDGTYRTSYETGNNIVAEESGYVKTIGEGDNKAEALVQQGSYSYTSPEGQIITIHYTADETGFHATGDHIPTPPPVSEEIQKGLDLIYAGIRQQEETAAREAAQKAQQPFNQQIDRQQDNKNYRL
ncbi:endocuticle structural glycoprotein SgAbd-2 [Diachasmimorpha longicaudata]|uniref:endocuticle structural glycoprotein SgAbd-2 n=1 Tax=Diachasmimorpha longicaudata TaxID=58733 RepID=UPI0030B8C1C2